MIILVTNDDGVHAPGLLALQRTLSEIGRVVVVAPEREMSAVSRAITMKLPLRMKQVDQEVYSVSGTPVDCVYMALYHILDEKPVLVVSGINKGPNIGDDVSYSGTVAAAAEATLAGIPAFAISLNSWKGEQDYGEAARFASALGAVVIEKGLPERTFLNVNVPEEPAHDPPRFVVTVQGRRRYPKEVDARTDPRGFPYYWIGGSHAGTWEEIPGSDGDAMDRGLISVTPLKLELTEHRFISELRTWRIAGFSLED